MLRRNRPAMRSGVCCLPGMHGTHDCLPPRHREAEASSRISRLFARSVDLTC
jgi:hypothetical protein